MRRKTGAEYLGDNATRFTVWAPLQDDVKVILKDKTNPLSLQRAEHGYWEKVIKEVGEGSLYKIQLKNGKEFPDPASRSQPDGVHSWSEVVDHSAFSWSDSSWEGLALSSMVIYELHVGTFTPEGTFEAVIAKLDHLLELGVNAIEIMPISQFPGNRNWGYDGVYPYAAQHSYGGVQGLKRMVDACHNKGIAVILDVVYNHMGPEGNYLAEFGPYFTDKYHTPWGSALNFDDQYSDEVRNFFIENALMWLEEFHIDGLRLDAVHEIIDRGARHLLKEISLRVDALQEKTGRAYVLIAESDLNDVKLINTYEKGGYGLEGQWVDDFHHALHTLLTGEDEGYYADFGKIEHLAKAYTQAFIYDGIYSDFRKRTVGNSPKGLPASKFVICIQNHDQIGNRMLGERLAGLITSEGLKLAATVTLTAPFVPMLFMGEEFAEDRPFQYFVSHGDEDLVKAVREGRKKEFQYFFNQEGDFQDPQAEETFNASKVNWSFREDASKRFIFEYYKNLLRLRKQGIFDSLKETNIICESHEAKRVLQISSSHAMDLNIFLNFNKDEQEIVMPSQGEDWKVLLASADTQWGGRIAFPKELAGGEKMMLPGFSSLIITNKIL